MWSCNGYHQQKEWRPWCCQGKKVGPVISFSIFAVYEGKWAVRETNKLFHLLEMETNYTIFWRQRLFPGFHPTRVRTVSSCRTAQCYPVDCHCRRACLLTRRVYTPSREMPTE